MEAVKNPQVLQLTPWQIENLAKPFVKMVEQYEKFFEDPENEKGFKEWQKQRHCRTETKS